MHPFVVLPELPPIIFEGKTYTRDELIPVINQLAERIKYHQRENDSPFVYLYAENHIKTILAWFAIMRADCSCVLVDPDLKRLELEHLMADTPPGIIIRFSRPNQSIDFDNDLTLRLPDPSRPPATQKRGYTIVYTAAEDGYAKGALLSVDNLLTNALALAEINGASSRNVICSLIPYSHLFALITGVFSPILTHSPILVQDINLTNLKLMTESLTRAGVTNFYSVPILLYLLSKERDATALLTGMHSITSGGYKLPEMISNLYRKQFDRDIQEGYGLTEASPVCSWHRPGDAIKLASVGRVFPRCRLKVIDADDTPLPAGQSGEICVQGGNVMEGYLNHPASTARVLEDGWLRTGDLGYLDSEGYVFLTGLKKRMIHVGGRNVYPDELERMLMGHPNADHLELSWTDSPLTGAKLAARIFLKKRALEEQKAFMQWAIQNISTYKLPKQWDFV